MFCSSTVERQGKYYRTPKEKVSLGLLFRGLMKEIIDRSSFATVRALLEGVPNLHHKPTTAPSGAKRLTRHCQVHSRPQPMDVASYNNATTEPANNRF